MRTCLTAGLALCLSLACIPSIRAADKPAGEKTAPDLLPASVVGYLEVPAPGKVVDLVLDHPLTAEVIRAPEYEKALQTPEYQKFAAVLKRWEERLGQRWPAALAELTRGGLT